MGKYIWMAVEADEYELPIVLADSAQELADICGVHRNTVLSSEFRQETGRKTGFRYKKVINDEPKESE